ncbi:HNH endonuclease [Pseudoalteromonas phenolica]|uniref:HNH endonuclease n=1 Tax=Pseudoalteromonas phenolica TaxID=161398 RepID=UPI00384D5106
MNSTLQVIEKTWFNVINNKQNTNSTILNRLLSEVVVRPSQVVSDECWLWAGTIDQNSGFGRISNTKYRTRLVHRVAYLIANGIEHSNLRVFHRCENPNCLRPSHLTTCKFSKNNSLGAKTVYERITPSKKTSSSEEYFSLKKAQFLSLIEKGDLEDGCWSFKGSHDKSGRPKFNMIFKGKRESVAARCSYIIFNNIESIPKNMHVGHVCGHNYENKACVNPKHLKLMTPKENIAYLKKCKRLFNLNKERLLPSNLVHSICKYISIHDPTNKEVANKFDISLGVVEGIRNKRTYRKITLNYDMKSGRRFGMRAPQVQLTDGDIYDICERYDSGADIQELQELFKVSRSYILDIVNGRKRNVTGRTVYSSHMGFTDEQNRKLVNAILSEVPYKLIELAHLNSKTKSETERAIRKLVSAKTLTSEQVKSNYSQVRSISKKRISEAKINQIILSLQTEKLTTKLYAKKHGVGTSTIERIKRELKQSQRI